MSLVGRRRARGLGLRGLGTGVRGASPQSATNKSSRGGDGDRDLEPSPPVGSLLGLLGRLEFLSSPWSTRQRTLGVATKWQLQLSPSMTDSTDGDGDNDENDGEEQYVMP